MGRKRPVVVHVVTWLDTGGAQETAARLCSGLQHGGWDAVLIGGAAPEKESPAVAVARLDGVAIEAVPWLGRSIHALSDAVALVRLVWRLRQLRPDVVHTHSSKAGLLGRTAAFLARVPVRVHSVHGWSFDQDLEGRARQLAIALERIVAVVTDAIVVVTAVDRSRGLAAGVADRSRYRLIRSAIEVDRYDSATGEERSKIKESWGLDPAAFVVGTVTRFAPPKDAGTLLGAFAGLRETHPSAQLVVVGDGPEREGVVAEIEVRGLGDHVTLLGHRDDVPQLLHGFDLFAFSSRREGLPRVVVEAVAAGLPVVSTDVGGVAEVLRLAPASRTVPVGDCDAMASSMRELLGIPVGGRAEARAAALAGFDESDMVDATQSLYEELTRG